MPDKAAFMAELYRVTKPGGRIIVVTWCHREVADGSGLQHWETRLLKRISDAYYLPAWVPAGQYVRLASELGLEDIRQDDWSQYVAPFWPAVIRSALKPANLVKMLWSGLATVKGAIASVSCIIARVYPSETDGVRSIVFFVGHSTWLHKPLALTCAGRSGGCDRVCRRESSSSQ